MAHWFSPLAVVAERGLAVDFPLARSWAKRLNSPIKLKAHDMKQNGRVAALALALLLAAAPVVAAPEDDYQKAMKHYAASEINEALALFKSASAAGHAKSKVMYDYVTGLIEFRDGDLLMAMTPLRRAAEAGYAPAQALYAYALNKGDENPEAERYYRLAVKQGDPDAKFGLAGMLIGGETAKKDLGEAKALIWEAAAQDHKQSILVVAAALLADKSILPLTDEDRAPANVATWLTKAAELEDMPALQRMERAHRLGELGLPVNGAEAARLAKKIAEITGQTEEALAKRKRKRR